MKYLLISIYLFLPNLVKASTCYVIDGEKIELRTIPERSKLNERCPLDDNGKAVVNIKDITYTKTQVTSCTDKDDCYNKTKDLCYEIENKISTGRPIVASDFSEVYCTKPIYDNTKRQARLLAEASKKAAEKSKKEKEKSDWAALCASPKAGLETLICAERGY